ncbi:1-deoxy-D-xylulose-5-phosphate reductoisomerase [Miltoncostaea marina]|uniref:1-deoxy-D-xylulose-5-phosphate reductoisomerase n=1 Tax=Miltoncostaea marina TaxID=2843215 RepID=UPI001C3D428D|nr:1-deoxy-D-xylulose-5-phosphate reductoisomerase [Miltoncostaea marina]
MARVLVLGSTGSIGVQALDVIDAAPDLEAVGLACGRAAEAMAAQAAARGIRHTACAAGGGSVPFDDDLAALIDASEPDIVLNALVGAAGLRPTLAALERGIAVALANKESLVAGGDLVAAVRARTGARLVPVDSEHSALFQLLEGLPAERVRAAVLTASGGPFRGRAAAELEGVTRADALRHPTWAMGEKITIDSATLMNKGLEVIEAHHLFGLPYERIEVIVHPQSLVHAMVRLDDGSVLTHCGPPDMRVPIGHALRHPQPPPPGAPMDLVGRRLDFEAPDEGAFPCLALARAAGVAGGTAPAVLNAANEVAVGAFLEERIGFMGVPRTVEAALDAVPAAPADTLDAVLDADARARAAAREAIEGVAACSA